MKMKEQNAYLSVVSFAQLIILTAGSIAATEYMKSERQAGAVLISTSLTVIACIVLIALYFKIFRKSGKKRNG